MCPTCKAGFLIPDQSTYKNIEPIFSKKAHSHEAWDPDWITSRFSVTCVCASRDCGEIAFVSGTGTADQRYDNEGRPEYYDHFTIKSFFPSPHFCDIPNMAPPAVVEHLERSFSLYWVDVSAAANALRASLEALLDSLKIPDQKKSSNGKTEFIPLHKRLELWSASNNDYAELCFALKEVGNLGSHGQGVREQHYFGSLEIYSHVLMNLFENSAEKMKKLSQSIRDDIKANKSKDSR